jgi:TATA-box binding protein (TBP) (component of TFIID and TFIIIB)
MTEIKIMDNRTIIPSHNESIQPTQPTQPTKYRVSTITCNASITTTINLVELFNHAKLGDDIGFVWIENGLKKRGVYPKKKKEHSATKEKKCFDNQLTVIYKYADGYYPNIKIFRNGNIQMTGIRTEEDGKNIVNVITKELIKITTTTCPTLVGNCKVEDIENKDFVIRMINCDFGVPFKIRRKNLHQLLISAKYGITCSFQPLTYPGVKSQYYWNSTQPTNNGICKCTVPCYGKGTGHGDGNCKKVTIATFDSGKILITGANSFDQVNKAYEFICAVIMDNQDEVKKCFNS